MVQSQGVVGSGVGHTVAVDEQSQGVVGHTVAVDEQSQGVVGHTVAVDEQSQGVVGHTVAVEEQSQGVVGSGDDVGVDKQWQGVVGHSVVAAVVTVVGQTGQAVPVVDSVETKYRRIPCRGSCFVAVDLEEKVEFILFF